MNALSRISACVFLVLASACGDEPDGQATTASADARDISPSPEDSAWRVARAAATQEAYSAYLDNYPAGLHAREATARHRILEIAPINLNVAISAPEGQYMEAAPPVLASDGSVAPSRAVAAVPEGTTLTFSFSANVNGEDITEDIVSTFAEMDGDRMIFRNDAGDCFWSVPATGGLGYCENAMPAPPDPSDIRGLMAYSWLAVANDR